MSDHHVDSMHINYSEAAKHFLQKHGLFINDAPPVNHKPGNDLQSDLLWPLPLYPDTRFMNYTTLPDDTSDKSKCNCGCDCCKADCDCDSDKFRFPTNFEILSDEIKGFKALKNPVISFVNNDRDNFIDGSVYPYTGLTLQVMEKRACNISFVKPFIDRDGLRKTHLIVKEIIEGHPMSIATFDGWKYHIYRGVCRYIVKVDPPRTVNGKALRPRTVPYGKNILEKEYLKSDPEDLVSRNMRIILDCSRYNAGEIANIPVNQIIDVEEMNHYYDFTIYEGDLKIFWDDWNAVDDHRDGKQFTYVPMGDEAPQTLYHEVVEHQKRVQEEYKRRLSESLFAVQYNEDTIHQLLYRLKRYEVAVVYYGEEFLIQNDKTKEYEQVYLTDWIIFNTDTKSLYSIYPNDQFFKKYGA